MLPATHPAACPSNPPPALDQLRTEEKTKKASRRRRRRKKRRHKDDDDEEQDADGGVSADDEEEEDADAGEDERGDIDPTRVVVTSSAAVVPMASPATTRLKMADKSTGGPHCRRSVCMLLQVIFLAVAVGLPIALCWTAYMTYVIIGYNHQIWVEQGKVAINNASYVWTVHSIIHFFGIVLFPVSAGIFIAGPKAAWSMRPLAVQVGTWALLFIGNVLVFVVGSGHGEFGTIYNVCGALAAMTAVVAWAVIVGRRIGQTNNFARRFLQCGVTFLAVILVATWLGLVKRVRRQERDGDRTIWILLAFPLVREAAYFLIIHFSYRFRGVPGRFSAVAICLVPLNYFSWTGRFLITTMDTWEAVTYTVLFQGASELFFRTTHRSRDIFVNRFLEERAVFRRIVCEGNEEDDDDDGPPRPTAAVPEARTQPAQQQQEQQEQREKTHHGVSVGHLMFIIAEYPSILGSGLIIAIASEYRMWFDWGYTGMEPIQSGLLAYATLLQLGVEFVVDLALIHYEASYRGIDLVRVWRQLGPRRHFVLFYAASCFVAFDAFQGAFGRSPVSCPETKEFCVCNSLLEPAARDSVDDAWCAVHIPNASVVAEAILRGRRNESSNSGGDVPSVGCCTVYW